MRATLDQLLSVLPGARLYAPVLADGGAAAVAALAAQFEGVSTDSRTVPAGALFVALRGEVFDAHDFLPQVAERGAAAVIAEQLPEGWALPAIIVPNTLTALGQIANWWRRKFALPLIGVTGSNGKTTVK